MQAWEQKKQEMQKATTESQQPHQMRTFDQANRSKKSLKKEAKK